MFIFYGDDIAEVCPCCTACSYNSAAVSYDCATPRSSIILSKSFWECG